MDIAVEVDSEAWGRCRHRCRDHPVRRRGGARPRRRAATAPSTVLLTGDEEAAALNLQHRGKAGATNVLSFPAPRLPGLPADEPPPLGDIVLAAGVVRREAAEPRHLPRPAPSPPGGSWPLHLLGHDHDTEEKAEEMAALEAMVLKQLDIGSGGRNYGRTSGAGGAAPFDR